MKKILFVCLLFSSIIYAQKPVFTSAKVTAATVYFNAAEITQTASATLPSGTSEIVIKNVADYVNESTVRIGAPESLTVLSVQFTRDYISEFEPDESSPVLKKVRDSITLVEKEIQNVNIAKYTEQKSLEILDRNQQVAGQQSGLSVDELTKLVEYYRAKRKEIALSENELNNKLNKLNVTLSELRSRLETNINKEEKTSKGKLVLQVMNDVAGNVPLEINYLTTGASWSPFYDLRADNISEPINMLYKAQVVQQTGIDWKKAKLTLSSGMPNQNNQAPLLQAWFLRFGVIYRGYDNSNAVMNTIAIRGASSINKGKAYEDVQESTISDYTTISENQLNVSFDIDVPYDILSNGKKHSVTLKEIKLPATYKHYAVPKLEKEAFLLAELKDYSQYNLLQGEANIIFEGMYIGKTYIDPNQTTDTLRLSMGRDKKISIKREKVADKSGSKFLSSYKEQTFTYDITVRNNKKEAVELILKDQYPISTDKEIEVELLKDDGAKVNTETGILTWELNLKPGETKKVRISYKVRYPKDKIIANL
ncbi:mucoidy inhibitor MuiA family protein [Flavobacterium salilacus subsp. salilacus]|uniref:DUF4139 domain-containing protein n=1 Tax=Flavobacterium TaxID=237 RepID=UPI00107541E8|nr:MULTISPECIES: DUF4139 domain-containing protein [Flavobacterium]KAF2518858.1 mucoidy inhibitor MuiA family protein [Flavobacterium salilacus subsp. salilacus]MBE1614982.1 mucoidy inhibitor MuiA family protein [Flavobacterium sp. SaA2.13]